MKKKKIVRLCLFRKKKKKIHKNKKMSTSLSTLLSSIGDICSSGVSPPSHVRSNVMAALLKISRPFALVLYQDILRIQLVHAQPSDTETMAEHPTLFGTLIDWRDPTQVERIYFYLVDNGKLTERLADCIELSMAQRRKKWAREARHASQDANLHVKCSAQNYNWSLFNLESRKENEKAHGSVSQSLSGFTSQSEEWVQLVMLDVASLKQKDRLFWYAIQTNRRSTNEKKAICHKLWVAKENKIFPQLLNEIHTRILSEIFVRTTNLPVPPRKAYGKVRRRIYKLFKQIIFFQLKRRAGNADADSNRE